MRHRLESKVLFEDCAEWVSWLIVELGWLFVPTLMPFVVRVFGETKAYPVVKAVT
jgi:hypothetical protein